MFNKLCDCHLHLYSENLSLSLEEYIEVSSKANVEYFFNTADSYDSFFKVLEASRKYEGKVFPILGIHPEHANNGLEYLGTALRSIEFSINKVVAIGEIGLDYHYDKSEELKSNQKTYFIEQIKFARRFNKPIVIHSRDAHKDTFDVLKEYAMGMKIYMHCYSGSVELAKEYLKSGLDIKFGIGGVVTFKNAKELVEVVKELDLKHFLSETDAPYLTPVPFRGTPNNSSYLVYIIDKIADIKLMDKEEVYKQLYSNAMEFFFDENK